MAIAYVEISLTQGKVALIDIDDAPLVVRYNWCLTRRAPHALYAVKSARTPDGRKTTISMHQLLTGWRLTDHVNGDGLDNRRCNLRPALVRQNIANQVKRASATSPYKGVCWQRNERKWVAQITSRGKYRRIGRFTSEIEAAHAYDRAARAVHGEFARVNFPLPGERSALGNPVATVLLAHREVSR